MLLSATLNRPDLFRSAFQSRKTGWIGMDVGTGSVKLAQVKKEGRNWNLLTHNSIPVPNEFSPEEFIPAVIQLLRQQPALFSMFVGRKMACSLPMSLVELQSMTLPEGSDDEFRLMIQQELLNSNTAQPNEQEFEFWENKFTRFTQPGMTEISVISALQQNILPLARQIQKTGCQCEVMNVLPFALTRAVSMLPDYQPEEPVAIFDWSTASPVLMIVQNGEPVFTRLFRNCGFSKLIQPLQNQMGLTLAESRQLLKSHQSTEPAASRPGTIPQAITNCINAPLKHIEREFSKTFQFVKQQRSDLWPQHLWLTGTGASLGSAEATLNQMTGIPTSIWNLKNRRSFTTDQQREEAVLQAEYTSAISLSSLAYEI